MYSASRKAETSATWIASHPEIKAGRVAIVEETMPLRQLLVLPRRWSRADRFHILKNLSAKESKLSPTPLPSRQAAFLFLARPERLDTQEQETVRQLRQSHPEVELAYDLVQQFAQMLRTRDFRAPGCLADQGLSQSNP
jgi:hypothetical protein